VQCTRTKLGENAAAEEAAEFALDEAGNRTLTRLRTGQKRRGSLRTTS